MTRGFWYVSSPYSKYPGGHDAAFRAACEQAGILHNAGIDVFSPIAHSHPLVIHGQVNGTDFEAWERIDKVMISASRGLILCKLPSWEISSGMAKEADYCRSLGKPVWPMEPGHIPDSLLPQPTEG